MERAWRLLALGGLGLLAVAAFFWTMAYPLGYGLVESAVVAAGSGLFGAVEPFLSDPTF